MTDLRRVSAIMKDKDEAFFRELGARVAQARKDKRLTQVVLAERLGIAQQTLAHYEGGRLRIAASMLPALAEILDLSIDELLTGQASALHPGKRGPTPRLQQQLEAIARLPRAKQRVVAELLDAMLAQQSL